jgi:hypothetical protein
MPRWVSLAVIVGLLIIVLIVVIALASGGHQPRPH